MITASHNPKQDNGVKIIEKTGAMLNPKLEKIVQDLVNTDNIADYIDKIHESVILTYILIIFIAKRGKSLFNLSTNSFSSLKLSYHRIRHQRIK